MDIETLGSSQDGHGSRKIALVDGMVVVQKLTKKPATVVTVKDLSEWFYGRLMSLTRDYDEVVLVFDTYKPDSLKRITREKRRQGKDPIQYQIRDDTNIKNIPMSRLLSHDQTKADLTEYLASKTVEYSKDSPKLVIASAAGHTESNSQLHFEGNNHEEADTLLIHHAVLASRRNPSDAQLVFFSPDTDVLHMAESDKLPLTLGALKQHVLRAHIQARVWGQADIAQQEFLDPLQNAYYKDKDGQLKPVTTEFLPAPEAIIERWSDVNVK
ncbi:hypothetical protein AAFF_G00034000 [Aldrovandia affinis]|uniref:Uncharacterized protein n=1 Tax=Aldrovandia affinis TaxID=143900 RepID=A0AAD7VXC0_9TELE|nr:hypothetical protein AAFF_G00034000 [Aldrovandia affinis]